MDEDKRMRAKRQRVKVTFPNGKVLCYKSVTDTMIATLKELGTDALAKVKLELCHLPLLSREVYPKYESYMRLVCDGWYVNTQTSTAGKFMLLRAINDQLALGLKVEIGDFETQDNPDKENRNMTRSKLLVKFPDGQCFACNSMVDTYLAVVRTLGVNELWRKGLTWGGNPLVTTTKQFNNQVQVDSQRWIIVPNMTKDKMKLLRVMGAMFRVKLEMRIL